MPGPRFDDDEEFWAPNPDEVTEFWHRTEDVIAEFTPEADDAFYHRLAIYTMGLEAAEALAAEILSDRET